jgi:hypothetical protein
MDRTSGRNVGLDKLRASCPDLLCRFGDLYRCAGWMMCCVRLHGHDGGGVTETPAVPPTSSPGASGETSAPARPVLHPIPRWVIAVGIPVMALVAVAAVWLLLGIGVDSGKLDAIRTGGTLGVGLGGVVVLWLAVRRQRSTELDLLQKYDAHQLAERVARHNEVHQLRVAQDARDDATERRITELYTKAVEQLGYGAPVRLGGLYALERLAQNNESQRQTIVNVICAYLRMPFTPPPHPNFPVLDATVHRTPSVRPSPTSPEDGDTRYQEQHVRLAAQRILAEHLRFESDNNPKYWADIDLDLTGATLIDFNLASCRLRNGVLADTTFIGKADFVGAVFTGKTVFTRAQFTDNALFGRAHFGGESQLFRAWFTSYADFENAQFAQEARFDAVRFDGMAKFGGAHLGAAWFPAAVFFQQARFQGTTFAEGPDDDFRGAARLQRAAVRMNENDKNEWPPGWKPDMAAEPLSLPDFPGTWRELRYTPPQE